jgi:hypothetical protein
MTGVEERKKANIVRTMLQAVEKVTGGASAASPLHAHVRRPQLRRHDAFLLPSRLVPHRHCPRAELQPADELQVDMLR